jgi:hypothetical protein
VLYTWTDRAQIEALRAAPVLLTRSASPTRGPSRFDRRLGDAPADRRLRAPGRTARRFAWTAAWATAMGFDAERYGDALLAVELRPDAVVGRFAPDEAPAWTFFDLAGAPVDEAAALPRLAAVLHLSPARGEELAYREVVLVDEAGVAGWSAGTPAIAATLREAAARIEALARRVVCPASPAACPADPAGPRAWAAELAARWAAPADGSPVDAYLRGLALPGRDYVPTPARLRALAARLRAVAADLPPALEHRAATGDVADRRRARASAHGVARRPGRG